ncbi:hypothetical protein Cni_G07281 [Canna indica]|uniref:WRKY domain-containing protein n=1 Tax=Canna indica TaxID=4628 RepID=A0AAQ3JY77_9LILI|nr:hypothetical protein Cni_G07281 [Canna indica]
MDAVNNWDLYAVVRGCSAATTAADPFFSSFPLPREDVDDGEKDHLFPSPDHFETSSILRELQELCKPFDPMESHHPLLSPAAPLLPAVACPSQSQRQPQSQTPRSKRRKNQQKKVVCQVPADGVHSDLWSWRKYGQKPIKGSPYPR